MRRETFRTVKGEVVEALVPESREDVRRLLAEVRAGDLVLDDRLSLADDRPPDQPKRRHRRKRPR